MRSFSEELLERRLSAGLSLRELEARIHGAVSYSMLNRYERGIGITSLSIEHARAISEAFDWSLDDMSKRIKIEKGKKK